MLRSRLRSRQLGRAVVLFVAAFVLLYVADGSRQPTSARDWRILGYQRGIGAPTSIVAVPDNAALTATWEKARLRGTPPAYPDGAAVYWFTATGSIGCPAHFAGFAVDESGRVVTAQFTRALTAGCDQERVPDSFVIAVDQARLPARPYRVELSNPADPPPPGDAIEVTS